MVTTELQTTKLRYTSTEIMFNMFMELLLLAVACLQEMQSQTRMRRCFYASTNTVVSDHH